MTQSVQCSSCGAPVPLAGAKGQRCFFCLSPVDVPPEIAEVLGDSEQLEARIAQRFRAVEHYRSGIRSQSTAMAGTLGGMIVIAYFGYTPMVQAGLRGDATQSVLFLLSFGLGAAFVFWPPVVWIRAHRRATHRGLCRLPFASVSLTDRIVPSCPNCGSSLKASAALTAVCGSCETESLLPAPLVSSRLQRKHARAVAAHEDFDDAQEEALSARVESQLAFGDSFSTLGKRCLQGGRVSEARLV